MLARFSALLPSAANFMQQIAPSVVATLIAAGLISGYNHAFSGHLKQPRMAALHAEETDAVELAPVPAAAPATATVATVKPPARPATNTVTIHERADEPERVLEKELAAELGKDQTAAKVAVAPAPSPRPATTTAATEPKIIDRRPDPRVASVPYVVPPAPAPVMVAPVAAPPAMAAPVTVPPPAASAPYVVPAAPPPVIAAQQPIAQQPMVTVPDRPYQRPPYEAQAEDAPPPPQPQRGPFGTIVDTLKPSSLFARAREFGQRIEAAGNDILPNIRQ